MYLFYNFLVGHDVMPGSVEGISLLSQGTGYGVLVGLGVAFAVVILVAVKLQKDYLSEDSGKSEMFMVANRSVGTGRHYRTPLIIEHH